MKTLLILVVAAAAAASGDFWAAGSHAAAASGSLPRLSQEEGASKDFTSGSFLFKLPPLTIEEKAGEGAEGAGKEEEVLSVFVAAEEGRPGQDGAEIARDSKRTPANRKNEGKQFQGQVNRFSSGRPGGSAPVTSVVGSDPLAAVSMIQSYVDEVISKPTGERPGYIMINSRNPAIINQLVAALTQRFGPSSVHQDAQTIQSIVGNSAGLGSSGVQAAPSSGNLDAMPVFPFSNRFEKTSDGVAEAGNDLSEVEYIRQQLASIADLSISTGVLVNDTMEAQGGQGVNKIKPSTPKTPVIVLNHSYSSENTPQPDIQNAILSETSDTEYTKPQSPSEETKPIKDVDKILANHLRENVSVTQSHGAEQNNSDFPSSELSHSSFPDFTGTTPEENTTPRENPDKSNTSLKDFTSEAPTQATKTGPTLHHKPETIEQGDLSENEVLTTGYEDYYEYIDGELVLSPSKFMRRGGPFNPGENKNFSDNADAGNVNDSGENIGDGVKADLSGFEDRYDENEEQQYYKWTTNHTESQAYPLGELRDQPNPLPGLAVAPVNPQVMEVLRGMEKGDLETLGLREKLEMIPVLEETSGNTLTKFPTLEQLPPQVLDHLFTMNEQDLQTLNLLDDLRQLRHTQNGSETWHRDDTVRSDEVQTNNGLSPIPGASASDHEERQQLRPNFSAANFRQSDAPVQNIPPNFFPNRPPPAQHQLPAPAPQLSPEQQQIISRLPAGMQDVVSSIVMAVQAPTASAATTPTPPFLPLPYPYPYPPYPYYPPPNLHHQVPATQQPNALLHGNDGSQVHHSGHGAHSQHSAHGSHSGHDAHGSHSSHGGHGSHTGHGAHDSHSNHENHGSHTGHGAHGSHDDHESHGSHTGHGAHGNNNHGGHGGHSGHDAPTGPTNDGAAETPSGGGTSLLAQRTQPLASSRPGSATPRPAVVSAPVFSGTSAAQDVGGETSPNSSVLASRVGELDSSGIRDNDNSGHGTVGLLCRNEGTSGFCENRLSVGGVANRPDRNQGLLQLRQDPAQMGNGRPSGGGIVNYRPPQQSSMQMGGPVINVVLPESQGPPLPVEEEEIGPLIDAAPPEPASDSAPEMMDREEMNSLLQSLFSSPTLLLLGIIFATSAAYMAIAMEEQAAQQRFQQAQLAAAFGGQQQFFQGRRRRHLPDVWYPKEPRFEKQNNR